MAVLREIRKKDLKLVFQNNLSKGYTKAMVDGCACNLDGRKGSQEAHEETGRPIMTGILYTIGTIRHAIYCYD